MPVCRAQAPVASSDALGRVECHLYDNALS
jgi:hypothetical protein